jgi:uncharacterized membrane protein YccC
MTTAYIVSQPLAGAVRSKAVYRVLGTMLGAVAAVALVPNLVNAPVLLSLALALWVGGCLAISLLDRTPRSYVLMLAGYTAAIIGFPSVNQPGAIFDVAVSRVVEIGLGIVCATLVHSLVFPRPVGAVLRQRLSAWLGEADRWALDVLKGQDAEAIARDRRHLAAAASEIHLLAVHLPFDTSRLRETSGAVRAFHDRMLLLIPLLSGLADRMDALRDTAHPKARAALNAVTDWIEAGGPRDEGLALVERLETLASKRRNASWDGPAGREPADAPGRNRHGPEREPRPDGPPARSRRAAVARARDRGGPRRSSPDARRPAAGPAVGRRRRDRHPAVLRRLDRRRLGRRRGRAGDGGGVLLLLRGDGRSRPGHQELRRLSLLSLPLSALYMFAVLPSIDGFPLLVLVMAPPLIFLGLYIPNPATMGAALAVLMGFCNALALQETFSADFASFLNANLGQFVGLLAAIMVTAGLRSMGADASARRLLGRTWRGLARLARARVAPEPAAFAALLVDRLGMLTPKLAIAGDSHDLVGVDALRDLRVGMNLVAVQAARPELGLEGQAAVDDALDGVGEHFAALASGRGGAPGEALLPAGPRLSRLIDTAAGSAVQGVSGLVGLRRNLFPDAPAFVQEPAR